MQRLDGEYVILVADGVEGQHSANKDVAQASSPRSAAPSLDLISLKETSWVWAVLSMCIYAIL